MTFRYCSRAISAVDAVPSSPNFEMTISGMVLDVAQVNVTAAMNAAANPTHTS